LQNNIYISFNIPSPQKDPQSSFVKYRQNQIFKTRSHATSGILFFSSEHLH